MMDLATIRSENEKAGRKAKRAGTKPYVFTSIDLGNFEHGDVYPLRKIPRIGDYEPKGWEKVESYFVDSSGFGREGELALTIGQFIKKVLINPGLGYGISEVGQFQIYVEAFRKVGS